MWFAQREFKLSAETQIVSVTLHACFAYVCVCVCAQRSATVHVSMSYAYE